LGQALLENGLSPHYNMYVDVAVLTPHCDILFEVKSATSENFLEQLRRGVGQLLEYRFRLSRARDSEAVRPVVVIEASANPADLHFAADFVASIGFGLVLWRAGLDEEFDGLRQLLCRVPVYADVQ
jgi:hypothetical protein